MHMLVSSDHNEAVYQPLIAAVHRVAEHFGNPSRREERGVLDLDGGQRRLCFPLVVLLVVLLMLLLARHFVFFPPRHAAGWN